MSCDVLLLGSRERVTRVRSADCFLARALDLRFSGRDVIPLDQLESIDIVGHVGTLT